MILMPKLGGEEETGARISYGVWRVTVGGNIVDAQALWSFAFPSRGNVLNEAEKK
jgi:hypothetical protein